MACGRDEYWSVKRKKHALNVLTSKCLNMFLDFGTLGLSDNWTLGHKDFKIQDSRFKDSRTSGLLCSLNVLISYRLNVLLDFWTSRLLDFRTLIQLDINSPNV